ncbi:MAG: TMEM43 family protein, partial [Thermoguttaceae bacterium]
LFKGILFGFVLIIASIALLFWNEGKTIKREKALTETGSVAVSVKSDSIDAANEDKVIHLSGDVTTDSILSDPDFNVNINALKLVRNVEMYQWKENQETKKERTSGGGEKEVTTYTYSKTWSPTLIDSSAFKEAGHENPVAMPFVSEEFVAANANLGAFSLTSEQIENLGPEEELDVTAIADSTTAGTPTEGTPTEGTSTEGTSTEGTSTEGTSTEAAPETPELAPTTYQAAQTAEKVAQDFTVSPAQEATPTISLSSDPSTANAQVSTPATANQTISTSNELSLAATATPQKFVQSGKGYYFGDPSKVKIGDIRVSFKYVATPAPTTFVAQQHGDQLISYQAATGSVFLQSAGIKSLDSMIQSAQKQNKMMAWLLRAVGLFLIFAGIKAILAPLEVLADIIPFAASIVGLGTGLVALCGSLVIGLTTISIGWLFYRPLVAIPFLIIAVGALIAPFILRGKKKQA